MHNLTQKIFVNIAVADLARSMDFFSRLGFAFNSKFTDANAACMIVNENAYFMLLTEPFFQGFTRRAKCDTSSHTEALFALSCSSRAEVDRLVDASRWPPAVHMPWIPWTTALCMSGASTIRTVIISNFSGWTR